MPETHYLKFVSRHASGERGLSTDNPDLAPFPELTGGIRFAWISEASAG